ncbi:hypothetical protein ACLMJK_005676 [Lecanora helva]
MGGLHVILALISIFLTTFSGHVVASILQLPSRIVPAQSVSPQTAVPSAYPASTVSDLNATSLTAAEWPSTPFTHMISDNLSITIDRLGVLATPENKKGAYLSLDIIIYNIAVGTQPAEEIDLPFYRTNQQVNLRFGGGLESTMSSSHMLKVLWDVSHMWLEYGPREILWAKVLVDRTVATDFSLNFRW